MNKQCRPHCYEAVHVYILHLFGLSWENFEVQIPVKIRFRFRAFKIHLDLWLLAYMIYMVRIVRQNATTFMLWVFIFMEKWESYRASGWLEEEDEVQGKGFVCVMLFWFHINQRMYSHASGKVARWWDPCPGFEPWRYLLFFPHFSVFIFWLVFAGWAWFFGPSIFY